MRLSLGFLFLFLISHPCFSQTDFVSNKTVLPKGLKENIVTIKVTRYEKDTLTSEFDFLTAKFDRENKLKKLTCHKKLVTEHYYLSEPSATKYIYKKHKTICKVYTPGHRCKKNIEYYKDTLIARSKYITHGGLQWTKTKRGKRYLELKRQKQITSYTYNQKIKTVLKKDARGNQYTYEYDEHKNCLKITYVYEQKIVWIQSYKYNSNNNLVEMTESNIEGKITWRQTNEYDDKNLLTCTKTYEYGSSLFTQLNFIYKGAILERREDLDYNSNSKTIFYYSYK